MKDDKWINPVDHRCPTRNCIVHYIYNTHIQTAGLPAICISSIYNIDCDVVYYLNFALTTIAHDSNAITINSSKESLIDDILDLIKKIEYVSLLG